MKSLAFLFAALALALPASATLRINEVHLNPPGIDTVGATSYEYIEIISDTGGVESTNSCKLLLLDADGGNMGRVDGLWDLSGLATGNNGLLLLGLNLASTGGGPWAGRLAPGTALGNLAIPPGKDGLIEPNRAWSLALVKNYTTAITVGVTDISNLADTAFTLAITNALQDAVGLNERRFNALDKVPLTPSADLSQLSYSPGNVSRLAGNTVANSAAAWFGGEVIGTTSTSIAFSSTLRFGSQANPSATPGAPNTPPAPADLRINEVAVNPAGTDGNHEFVELLKIGGEATTGLGYHLLVVNTDPTGDVTCSTDRSSGVIVEAWNLDEVEFGVNGLALIGQGYDEGLSPWRDHVDSATPLSDIGSALDPDPVKLGNNDIGNEIYVREAGFCVLDRNNEGFSLLLVKGFSGAPLQDLDTDNNGTLDVQPWTALVDSVGYSGLAPTYALADLGQPGYQPDNLSRKAGNTTANSAAAFYGGNHAGANPFHIGFGSQFFGGFLGQATPGRLNLAAAAPLAALVINEVNFDPPGDAAEFIELKGAVDRIAPAQGHSLLVVATDSGNRGEVLHAYDLRDLSTGLNGLLLMGDGFETQAATIFPAGTVRADSAVASGPPGFTAGDLPDQAFALLLAANFNGAAGTDLDADNNGAIDPGFTITDGITFGQLAHPAVTDLSATPQPDNVSRGGSQSGAPWYGGTIAGGVPGGLAYGTAFGPWTGTVTPGQGNHAAAPGNGLVLINEANINPPGDDANYDFVELIATAVAARSMNGLTLLAIDTNAGADGLGNIGEISRVWNLDALATGRNGLLLLGDGYAEAPAGGPFAAAKAALTATGDPVGMTRDALASNDGIALLLVRGFSGQLGQDLDAANDNVLDATPWTQVVDAFVFGNRNYGFPNLTQAAYVPDNVSRGGRAADLVANSAARWYGGSILGAAGTATAFDPVERFNYTGAVFSAAATPGDFNLGGVLDDEVDNDLDGQVNLVELALASDPDLPGDAAFPVGSILDVGGQPYLALTFSRVKGGSGSAGDYTANGIRYVVQVSATLTGWAAAGAELVQVAVTDDGNGVSETVVVRLTTPSSASVPKRFLRLQAIRL
jgi:hypothetical protein